MIPYRRANNSGIGLASALVSMLILAVAMTVVLQAYMISARTLRVTSQRNAATLALEAQLESFMAAGYAKLPPMGRYPIPVSALPGLKDASGETTIALGPSPDTREITARVSWDDNGKRREHLTIVMAAGGLNP